MNGIRDWWRKNKDSHSELNDLVEICEDPIGLIANYIVPELQEANPADVETIESCDEYDDPLTLRVNAFEFIKTFLGTAKAGASDGRRHLMILADAGMGKSSLLAVVYLILLNKMWDSESLSIKIMKISETTLKDIEDLTNRPNTILLLDALDEDPTISVIHTAESRLEQLLRATTGFLKVVITCRTQFFSKPLETMIDRKRKIEIGGFQVQTRFLSPFSDAKVKEYIDKKYQKLQDNGPKSKRKKALRLSAHLKGMACRPLILSYIDDLLDLHVGIRHKTSDVYGQVIDKWLNREIRKCLVRAEKTSIYQNLSKLAYSMACHSVIEISIEDILRMLGSSTAGLPKEEREFIVGIEFSGRSILNKKSNGNIRFAHKSFLDYLCAEYVYKNGGGDKRALSFLGKTAHSFIQEWLLQDTGTTSRAEVVGNPRIDFHRFTFGYLDVSEHRFEGINFSRGSFCGSPLRSLSAEQVKSSKFNRVKFSNCDFSQANFDLCIFTGCHFMSCKMKGAFLGRTSLVDTDFNDCDLTDSVWQGASGNNVIINKGTLEGAAFVGIWRKIELIDVLLQRARMSKSGLDELHVINRKIAVRRPYLEDFLRNQNVIFDGRQSEDVEEER